MPNIEPLEAVIYALMGIAGLCVGSIVAVLLWHKLFWPKDR